jgi:hypothetical protein
LAALMYCTYKTLYSVTDNFVGKVNERLIILMSATYITKILVKGIQGVRNIYERVEVGGEHMNMCT